MFKKLLKVVAAPIYVPLKVIETVAFVTTDAVLTQIEKNQMTEITRKTAKVEETKQEEKVRPEDITNITRKTAKANVEQETAEPTSLRELFNQEVQNIREEIGDDVADTIVSFEKELREKMFNGLTEESTVNESINEVAKTKETKLENEYNEKLEKLHLEQTNQMKDMYERHVSEMIQQIEKSDLSAEDKEELKKEYIDKATETYNIEIENLEESVEETKEEITNITRKTAKVEETKQPEVKQETKDVIEITEEIPDGVLERVPNMIRRNAVKSLRHLFINSLDDDPTFESYRPSYDFATKYVNIFEKHEDITPFESNYTDGVNNWTKTYYATIANDMRMNFSKERFEHMMKVAPMAFYHKTLGIRHDRGVDVFGEFIKDYKEKPIDELEKIILKAVHDKMMELIYIPDEYFTGTLCWGLLKNNTRSIRYFPENSITLGMAAYAVKENGRLLRQIPNNLKTAYICKAAVEENIDALYFVPQDLLEEVIISNHITVELAERSGIANPDILEIIKEVNNVK